jgi:hypothetical protein
MRPPVGFRRAHSVLLWSLSIVPRKWEVKSLIILPIAPAVQPGRRRCNPSASRALSALRHLRQGAPPCGIGVPRLHDQRAPVDNASFYAQHVAMLVIELLGTCLPRRSTITGIRSYSSAPSMQSGRAAARAHLTISSQCCPGPGTCPRCRCSRPGLGSSPAPATPRRSRAAPGRRPGRGSPKSSGLRCPVSSWCLEPYLVSLAELQVSHAQN